MRARWLVAFPLLWAAAFLVLAVALVGTSVYGVFLRTEIELVKILAAAGGLAAAFAHRPGDYMRKAWFLVGASPAIFLVRDLTTAPLGFDAMGETALLTLRAVLVFLGNLAMVAGVFMLARAWSVAGLALPGRRRGQIAVVLAAAALSFTLAGPAVVQNGGRLLAGDLTAASGVASALGDAATLLLVAPLLLTALALRGGMFFWPWALITASCLSWLFYDAFLVLGPSLGLGADGTRIASEVCRALGCTFGGSAGLAQRSIALGRGVT